MSWPVDLIQMVERRVDVRADEHGALRPQHDVTGGEAVLSQAKGVPRPAPHAVAIDRAAKSTL